MQSASYHLDPTASLFVKQVMVFQQEDTAGATVLPFFADGYPGLLFHITPGGQRVLPQNKEMPVTYLHGQTLHPIELHMKGAYKIIVIRLFPFVLRSLFNINARDLNNNCYDLQNIPGWVRIEQELLDTDDTERQAAIIISFLKTIFISKKEQLDNTIVEALQIIFHSKAQITVADLCSKLHITPRTFERRFLKEVGISAKDFIQITRFQQSLEQLTGKDYSKLSDIVYANGFSDQSHFIRVFKAFTGKTPKHFARM